RRADRAEVTYRRRAACTRRGQSIGVMPDVSISSRGRMTPDSYVVSTAVLAPVSLEAWAGTPNARRSRSQSRQNGGGIELADLRALLTARMARTRSQNPECP